MSTILAVEQLSQTYRSGDRSLTVLKDVSFSIDKGESLAIVGPSGSGKTYLTRKVCQSLKGVVYVEIPGFADLLPRKLADELGMRLCYSSWDFFALKDHVSYHVLPDDYGKSLGYVINTVASVGDKYKKSMVRCLQL